jgi:prophage regulatory protein
LHFVGETPLPEDIDRIIDRRELLMLVPYSFSQVTRLEAAGQFPARIRLSPGRVGWSLAELTAWIEAKKAERETN